MRLGNVELKNNIFLAPLHGFTVNAFRLLCKDYGAGLVFAPLMNENALLNNPNEDLTKYRIAKISKTSIPWTIQFLKKLEKNK